MLDTYSEIIINAISKVKNAVVRIDVMRKRGDRFTPAGSGSGFIFSSDGLLFTNDHAPRIPPRLVLPRELD